MHLDKMLYFIAPPQNLVQDLEKKASQTIINIMQHKILPQKYQVKGRKK